MKRFAYLFVGLALTGLIACGGGQHGADHGHQDDSGSQTQTKTKDGLATNTVGGYGAEITSDNAISIDDLTGKVNADQPMKAKVKATVSEVCQKKGCWMTLNRADGTTMRVTFKDYGFFVPKDLSGREVIIEGMASIETTEVDVLKHYAEDAGKSKEEIEAITEPESELVFEAIGVLVL